MSAIAYIGLGSNLNNPVQQIQMALIALANLAGTKLKQVSSLYQTLPWGPIQNQPLFVNAVAELKTELNPRQLLTELLAIELRQGRQRETRWGPRSLDLDILLYSNQILDENDLQVPHPRLCEREFVVYPLLELQPHLRLPDGRLLEELVTDLEGANMQKLATEAITSGINHEA